MRKRSSNILAMLGAILILGLSTALADDAGKKPTKDEGILSIKTTEAPYPVRVDGVIRGNTGVGTAAVYNLPIGTHKVEVLDKDGSVKWSKDDVLIRRGEKNCVCLKEVSVTTKHACPYNFRLDGPERILEGEMVTFAAINSDKTPFPLKYVWTVANGEIKNGQGTPTITVDSVGMAGKTINASLDVNDDLYDNKCRQVISVPTEVTPKPELPQAHTCDEFFSKSADDDKARFDNCSIMVQNVPDGQLLIAIYPGTDKLSTTRNTYDRLSKRALDYLVKNRGVDPRRIRIVKGSPVARTKYVLWIIPPGAPEPVIQ